MENGDKVITDRQPVSSLSVTFDDLHGVLPAWDPSDMNLTQNEAESFTLVHIQQGFWNAFQNKWHHIDEMSAFKIIWLHL